jgi:hypothetical protein
LFFCLRRVRLFDFGRARFLLTPGAWRAATVLGRLVVTGLAGVTEPLCSTVRGSTVGAVAAGPAMPPEAKRRKLNAMARCASSDIRAACHGEMNHEPNIVVSHVSNQAKPQVHCFDGWQYHAAPARGQVSQREIVPRASRCSGAVRSNRPSATATWFRPGPESFRSERRTMSSPCTSFPLRVALLTRQAARRAQACQAQKS